MSRAAFLIALCLAASAHAEESGMPWVFNAPPGEGYSIELKDISPTPGTRLNAGDSVEFKVSVSYSLAIADKGIVVLVFQDDAGELAQKDRPQVSQPVTGPSGSLTLSDTVLIPGHATELYLFVPLVPDGLRQTTGEITVRYPIDPHVPADAPEDVPHSTDDADAMELELAPYIEQARASYPAARERFLSGLPPKHGFFVTIQLRDGKGHVESVFIAVDDITGKQISGRIWNDIELVEGYEFRQPLTFPESDVRDWTILRPDGTEEGNFIGKYLDSK